MSRRRGASRLRAGRLTSPRGFRPGRRALSSLFLLLFLAHRFACRRRRSCRFTRLCRFRYFTGGLPAAFLFGLSAGFFLDTPLLFGFLAFALRFRFGQLLTLFLKIVDPLALFVGNSGILQRPDPGRALAFGQVPALFGLQCRFQLHRLIVLNRPHPAASAAFEGPLLPYLDGYRLRPPMAEALPNLSGLDCLFQLESTRPAQCKFSVFLRYSDSSRSSFGRLLPETGKPPRRGLQLICYLSGRHDGMYRLIATERSAQLLPGQRSGDRHAAAHPFQLCPSVIGTIDRREQKSSRPFGQGRSNLFKPGNRPATAARQPDQIMTSPQQQLRLHLIRQPRRYRYLAPRQRGRKAFSLRRHRPRLALPLPRMPRPGNVSARSGTISPSGDATKRTSAFVGLLSRVTMQRRCGIASSIAISRRSFITETVCPSVCNINRSGRSLSRFLSFHYDDASGSIGGAIFGRVLIGRFRLAPCRFLGPRRIQLFLREPPSGNPCAA